LRRQLKIITVIATVLLLTCLSVAPVYAQPPICTWNGTATLDGVAGTTVSAQLADGTEVGTAAINPADASYYMRVTQVGGVPAEGEILSFYVDGFLGGTDAWNAGGLKTLNLAAVTGPPPTFYDLAVNISPAGGGTVTGDGINCPGDCTEDYAEGTVVQLTATANAGAGFEFVNWSGDASGTNPTVNVTMNADKTVTANFRIPGEYVLKPGLNTLSTPAYLASTLGDIIPADYGIQWIGYELNNTSGTWVLVNASTTIEPLDGFVIINLLTYTEIELDVDNWPWAEWEEGDTPLFPPTKQLCGNRWALVGPAPGLVDGAAPDISVDNFLAGVNVSRIVSPGWGTQAAWAIYFDGGWPAQMVEPYKAYFVFPTKTSVLTGSCTLP
jgi:uncharacterized repeat protein (TIGR02543 family)